MKKLKELLFLKNLKGVGKVAINKDYVDFVGCSDGMDRLVSLVKGNGKTQEEIDKALAKVDKILEAISSDRECRVLTVFDEEYPQVLSDMGNKRPVILYVKGNTEALAKPGVAVIGTRTPSEWSVKVEERLVGKMLSLSNPLIISGLALGCDGIAHEVAVRNGGTTVAVLPGPLDSIVPKEYKDLAKQIVEAGGCLVTEYEPGTAVFKNMFVERDAIVAALSGAVCVIECGVKSGTMHTVEFATEYHRKIGCYIPDDMSKGNYEGNAHIVNDLAGAPVTNTESLVQFLGSEAIR